MPDIVDSNRTTFNIYDLYYTLSDNDKNHFSNIASKFDTPITVQDTISRVLTVGFRKHDDDESFMSRLSPSFKIIEAITKSNLPDTESIFAEFLNVFEKYAEFLEIKYFNRTHVIFALKENYTSFCDISYYESHFQFKCPHLGGGDCIVRIYLDEREAALETSFNEVALKPFDKFPNAPMMPAMPYQLVINVSFYNIESMVIPLLNYFKLSLSQQLGYEITEVDQDIIHIIDMLSI